VFAFAPPWILERIRSYKQSMAITEEPSDLRGGIAGDAKPELLCWLLYLPAELLVAIATQLAEGDELAASLACRKLREAVAGTKRRATGARLSTGSAR
jgi:hypothetical protein